LSLLIRRLLDLERHDGSVDESVEVFALADGEVDIADSVDHSRGKNNRPFGEAGTFERQNFGIPTVEFVSSLADGVTVSVIECLGFGGAAAGKTGPFFKLLAEEKPPDFGGLVK